MKRKYFLEHTDALIFPYAVKRPVDWVEEFQPTGPLDIEIGSGLGEFILRLAQRNPQRNFLGIETNLERVQKILRNLKKAGLKNVRILPTDARVVLERMVVPGSVDCLYCLFPCPWPKRDQAKHRLFTQDFLQLVNSRLVKDGKVKIVTDYHPFVQWLKTQIPETGFSVEENIIHPQFDTKFERKWLALGQKEFFELQLIKEKHIDIPLKEDFLLKEFWIDDFDPEGFSVSPAVIRQSQEAEVLSIVFKEFFYDGKRFQGTVHVIVVEKNITQHFWIAILKKNKWLIAPLEGCPFIPTVGIQMALEFFYKQVIELPFVKQNSKSPIASIRSTGDLELERKSSSKKTTDEEK